MAVCSQCRQEKAKDAFSKAQFRKTDATRRCKQCIEAEGCQEASSTSARQIKARRQEEERLQAEKASQAEKTEWLEQRGGSESHKRASLFQPPPPPPPLSPLPEDMKTRVEQIVVQAANVIMQRGIPTGFELDGSESRQLVARLWEICNNSYMMWLTIPLLRGLVYGETAINEKVHYSQDEEKQTILMWVCQYKLLGRFNYCGAEDMVALVLAAGADITSRLTNGCNALFFAVKYSSAQAVEMLLDAGVKVDDTDIFGNTIWKNATERPDLEIIKVLINRCNKIIPVDKESFTIQRTGFPSIKYTLPDNMLNIYASLMRFTDNPTTIPISWQAVGAPKMDDLVTTLVRVLQAGARFSPINMATLNDTDPLATVMYIDSGIITDYSEPQKEMCRLLRDVIFGRRLPAIITEEIQRINQSCAPNDTCPICLTEMEPSDNPVTLYCGHKYCLECIKDYGKANLDGHLTHRLESITIGEDGQLRRNMRAEGTDKRCPICRRLLCGDLLDQEYNEKYRSLVGLRLGIDHHESGGDMAALANRGPHLLTDEQLRFECKVVVGKTEGTRESLLKELLRTMRESSRSGSAVKIGDEIYPVNGDGVQVELSSTFTLQDQSGRLLHPPHWGPVVIPIQVKGIPILASLSPSSIFTVVPKAVVNSFGLKIKPITSSQFKDVMDKRIKVAAVVDEIRFFLQDVEICLNNAVVLKNETGIMNIQLGKDFFETAMWTRCSVRLSDDAYVVSDGGYTTNMFMKDQPDELRYYSRSGKICQVPFIHIKNYSDDVSAPPKIIKLPNFSARCGECQWCCRYFPCDGMLKYNDGNDGNSTREFRYYCDEECKAKGMATRSES